LLAITFTIKVPYGGRTYRMTAERMNMFPSMELWEVRANNRLFRMETNRPFIEQTKPACFGMQLDNQEWPLSKAI